MNAAELQGFLNRLSDEGADLTRTKVVFVDRAGSVPTISDAAFNDFKYMSEPDNDTAVLKLYE